MKHSKARADILSVDGWISLTANEPGYGTKLNYVYGTLTEVVRVRFQAATEENLRKFRVNRISHPQL